MAHARALLDFLLAALWQDACIAILAGAVLAVAGRRLNAATRYAVLHGMLLAMVIVPLWTTIANADPRAPSRVVLLVTTEGAIPPAAAANEDLPATNAPRIRVASSDALVLALTGAWCLGILVFAGRVAAGSMRLSRIVRRSERLPDRDGVRIWASPDLTMPLAFGFFRPSVAVPAALAARDDAELECILLHELAHVRRRDVWAHAWERLLQAVLLFNPAVVLAVRAIAFEREAACDDRAVWESRDLDVYARSLASFALRRAGFPVIAACRFTGFGGATVARLRRLDDARRNGTITITRSALGGFTTMLLLLALGLQMFAPSIALAADDRVVAADLRSNPCPRRVMGPKIPADLPPGLRAEVEASASPQGLIGGPTLVTSSGNARFDRVTIAGARKLLVAAGEAAPPSCHGVTPGTYHIALESGVRLRADTHAFRWTVRGAWMKKPIVLTFRGAPSTAR
jgi:beta-lactamase regulating signal transducer with metallopeptidase domain